MRRASFGFFTELLIITNQGFYSKTNVDMMLSSSKKFVIAVPFSVNFAKNCVAESKRIDKFENSIVIGKDTVFGICKRKKWGQSTLMHTFFIIRKSRLMSE